MSARFRIFLAFAAVAIGAIAAAWAYLFWTPPGRASLRDYAAAKVGDAIGGDASIGALKGNLPGEIILENVKISDAGEEWLRVQRAELRWRPFALFGRKVDIDILRIDGVRLLDAPPDSEDDDKKPRGFELPDRLPYIKVNELILTDIRVAESVAGNEVRVGGGGSVNIGGRTLKVSLNATSNDDRDFLSAKIERSGDALATDVILRSQSDGALAAIARLGGPIYLEAKGDGPLASYRLEFSSKLGGYSALSGAVSGDIERMESISFEADATLGERLKNTAHIVGPEAAFEGAFSPHDGGGTLTVSSFKSALGQVKGKARWQNRNKALDSVKIDASAELDSAWRPDIRPYIGDSISVDGEIRPKSGNYSASGKVNATYFDGILKSVETDLRTFARGPADVQLKSNGALPPGFELGADASGEFNLLFGDSIEATPIELKTSQGGAFGGDAFYNFDTRAFSAKGDATASPEMMSAFNSKLTARRNVGGVINIKGTLDNFSGTVAATMPPLLFGKTPFPAARVTLAFADAPTAPSGQVAIRAVGDALRLDANFSKVPSGAWRAASIDYVGTEFALKGSATLDPSGDDIALDLAYRGVGAAEPWPGFPLAGDFTAKGAVARGASTNRLTVNAGALASRNWSVAGLSATVEGPSNRLAVKASADFLSARGAAPLSKISTEMTAAMEDALFLTVSKLSADAAGAPVKLSRPSKVILDEGVAIENFRAAIGRNGSLALDGAIDDTRWRGKLSARRAPIVSAASVVDLDIDLDTNRQMPATGSFKLSSLLTKTENATLSGKLVWNGRTLDITDDGGDDVIDLSLSLPVRLSRSPQISISTDGPLNGRASYSGRIETIAGFLPAALQSIEGDIAFSGSASGALAEPKLVGTINIANGAFTELATGLSIVNIEGSAHAEGALTGSQIKFNASGSGHNQKEKTIVASGSISLGREPRLSSKTTFNGAKLSAGPVSEVEASGQIDLSGPFSNLLAKGELTVSSLDARVFTPESTGLVDVNVVAVDGNGGPTPSAIGYAAPTAVNYAVRINGDDRIFVRGRGLTSEWRANVEIVGRADQPIILGAMTMKNGDITFAGRRFEMTKGEIAFDRLSVNNPSLDLRAERETRSGTQAAIVIEGRARAPKVTLTSTPTLPPEDIMALGLFDKPASELSAIESLQVAEGLAELGGIGPFGGSGITGSARQALGLDLLNVDIDEADSAASSLTVGKYVADGLFVSATQDARGENGSVRVEYEIDQSFTVETELRQDGEQTVSANWKHDF